MSEVDPPVVLLGGDANAVSAVRSAGRRGLQVYALPQLPGRRTAGSSRYVTSAFRLRAGEAPDAAWQRWLGDMPPSVVVPLSDVGLEYVIAHRADLVRAGHCPAEGDDRFLGAMLDKQETYRLADEAGVERPKTSQVAAVDEAVDAAGDIGFPCALKPRTSHHWAAAGGSGKAVVVSDEAELLRVCAEVLAVGAQMMLTEIIPGPDDAFSSYYGYRDAEGRELLHYTKRKLRQYPIHFGGGTYHLTEHVPEAAELGRRFFASAGLLGLGNVEFKRDARDGRLKLIECNPRITAAAELVRRSGIDLLDVVYAGALGRPIVVGEVRNGLYQWLPRRDIKAWRAYRRAGELTTGQWLRSLAGRQSFPFASFEDPGPAVRGGAESGRRAFRRIGMGSGS